MLIKVKVLPSSKKEEVIKKSKDSFYVKVREKPLEGRANKAVIKVIALHFKVPEGKIRLVKGAKQRNKIFEINF